MTTHYLGTWAMNARRTRWRRDSTGRTWMKTSDTTVKRVFHANAEDDQHLTCKPLWKQKYKVARMKESQST